jgi:hypothetical protein
MIYRATFKHVRIFIGFLTVFAVGIAIVGLVMHTTLLIIVGLLVLAYLYSARCLRSITLTDEGIEFKGIIRRWFVNWQEIRHVRKLKEYRWPINRIFGEFTYEIQTGHGCRFVSFLFFHGDCIAYIKEKIRPNNSIPLGK